jgi:L-ascorbate metabolism protein UlaG (beta-lactamase superfamily)
MPNRTMRSLFAVITLLFTASLVVAQGCASGLPVKPKAWAPAHHLEVGFRNPFVDESNSPNRLLITRFWVRRFWASLFEADPVVNLPRNHNNGRLLRDNGHEATVTWVGHSTLLVQLEGVNLLTDPHWNQRASPVNFTGPKRFTEPGLQFEDLPHIDLVVISHDHYDHLDLATVLRLAETHRPRFFVPLGLKEWFRRIGIDDVVELDWWDSSSFKHLTITSAPAQHFSGRTPWDRNRTLWAGWVIAGREKRFYFAGDTGYNEGLKEIGRRLGPFQLAAIPVAPYGASNAIRTNHVTPEEAIQLFLDVGGELFVPIHWGTFFMPQALDEPVKRAESEAERLQIASERLLLLQHGESRSW